MTFCNKTSPALIAFIEYLIISPTKALTLSDDLTKVNFAFITGILTLFVTILLLIGGRLSLTLYS